MPGHGVLAKGTCVSWPQLVLETTPACKSSYGQEGKLRQGVVGPFWAGLAHGDGHPAAVPWLGVRAVLGGTARLCIAGCRWLCWAWWLQGGDIRVPAAAGSC